MKGSTTQPKAFISYSWSNPSHEQWVLELAERLMSDGIQVVLDKWDLKEGQDKHEFMEKTVSDPEIIKTLVICDSLYQKKANDRQGGVGTETQLISKEVYENTGQEKFIPIIAECDADGKPCMPHFISNRIYIDLSSSATYEENYQKLVRNLYNKPLLKKPVVGGAPSYITEENQYPLKTRRKVKEIKDAILNGRSSANGLITDYLDLFISNLEDFKIQATTDTPLDEKVFQSIEGLKELKDDFVEFAYVVFNYHENVDLEKLHSFFERLIEFMFPTEEMRSWNGDQFDNFKFFNYELMLNFITVLLKLKKYKEVAFFVHSQYFYTNNGRTEVQGIEVLNNYIHSLDEDRKRRLNLNRISITADLIKEHSIRKDVTFEDIKQTDLVIHCLRELYRKNWGWFPRTSVYNFAYVGINLFERLISVNHFEKIKVLFPDINSIEALKSVVLKRLEDNRKENRRYDPFNYKIPALNRAFNMDNMGTIS